MELARDPIPLFVNRSLTYVGSSLFGVLAALEVLSHLVEGQGQPVDFIVRTGLSLDTCAEISSGEARQGFPKPVQFPYDE